MNQISSQQMQFFPRRKRRGYVILIALFVLGLLSVLGTTTLNISGIDYQIAIRNKRHMLVLNTASGGNEDARNKIQSTLPASEGYDAQGYEDTSIDFISQSEAEGDFGGLAYTHNLGVYWVDAFYQRCGNPPPGYSTELGRNGFRSDYWDMKSTGKITSSAYVQKNPTEATTHTIIRMVMKGPCRVR